MPEMSEPLDRLRTRSKPPSVNIPVMRVCLIAGLRATGNRQFHPRIYPQREGCKVLYDSGLHRRDGHWAQMHSTVCELKATPLRYPARGRPQRRSWVMQGANDFSMGRRPTDRPAGFR